ncbi:MAG: cytochrome c peroxidase [Terriglobia bacterium]
MQRVAAKAKKNIVRSKIKLSKLIAGAFSTGLVALMIAFASQLVWAQLGFGPDPPPPPGSLKLVQVPVPANLSNYVVDKQAAIVLGKALFWEHQAGSDGLACASCHFHAGADNRTKNQIDPDLRNTQGSAYIPAFHLTASNKLNKVGPPPGGGPNYTLKSADFPYHQLLDPQDRNSAVIFDTPDVTSSQGVFHRDFMELVQTKKNHKTAKEVCLVQPTFFSVKGVNVRQVEPRNTPTVINAAFNFRNFWDGRANNIFNGRNPFGLRDTSAGVDPTNSILAPDANGNLIPEPVAIPDASLASQSVGPILSNLEMSCNGRTFENVGRKLLSGIPRPLANQDVAKDDSVLGPYRHPSDGLKTSYKALIQKAFNSKYWSSSKLTPDGYTQMENNFPLFWGLAIQLYESTLISDDTPFDQFMDGNPAAMTAQQQRGFQVYLGNGGCIFCHKGAEFTGAATSMQVAKLQGAQVEHMVMGDGGVSLYDTGFYNIGVRPPSEDIGLGGSDAFGNPLSWTRLAVATAAADPSKSQFGATILQVPLDNILINTCNFQVFPCVPITGTFRDAVDGAFKVPTLRNVELTGPYFHNGSRATLEQVVEFYKRGGDRRGPDGNDTTGYGLNSTNMAPNVFPLTLTSQDEADLVAFLMALTDERVRWEKAPFDHPSLQIPSGHPNDELKVVEQGNTGQAVDDFDNVPAVGQLGRSKKQGPLMPFSAGLK